ncbi:putative chitinase [Seiridium cardinale]|uniref:Chitinase n=1 Tax=Seiridium cardinale TaxID=138064 RepID=A0ABR2XMD8_9PEZI
MRTNYIEMIVYWGCCAEAGCWTPSRCQDAGNAYCGRVAAANCVYSRTDSWYAASRSGTRYITTYLKSTYNFENWATDKGKDLHDNENGCGSVSGGNREEAHHGYDSPVHFDLSYFIKSGCVERTMKSAGGPELSCVDQGDYIKEKRDWIQSKRSSNTDRRLESSIVASASMTASATTNSSATSKSLIYRAAPTMMDLYNYTATYKYISTNASYTPYTPMVWSTTASAAATESA